MNTNSQQLETIDIPLSKLLAWGGNVRTQTSETGIKELAASIVSVGLLQSIVVQKAPKGKYSVIAGRRRLLALSKLMDDGKVSSRFPVPCRLAATDSDLTEISLAENIFHEPMGIIQEILAFRRWVQEGRSAGDIAVKFGTSEAVVNRRLALADVSPVLLEKCESGEINLAILQAFTLTSDHAAQETLWEQLPRWDRKPETIRALLSRGDVPAADQRVRFVGLDAYEAEGGIVRRDLFAEGEDGTWICDPALLQRLVAAKLETVAAGIKAEGWKWVAIEPNANHQFLAQFRRLAPAPVPMSAATQKTLAKLQEKAAQLQEEIDAQEDDDVRELIARQKMPLNRSAPNTSAPTMLAPKPSPASLSPSVMTASRNSSADFSANRILPLFRRMLLRMNLRPRPERHILLPTLRLKTAPLVIPPLSSSR